MTIASKATHVLHSWHPVKLIATNKKKFKSPATCPKCTRPPGFQGWEAQLPRACKIRTAQLTVLTAWPAEIRTAQPTALTSRPTKIRTAQPTVLTPECQIRTAQPTVFTSRPVEIWTAQPTALSPRASEIWTAQPTVLPSPPLPHMASAWRQQHTHSSAQRPKRAPRWAPMVERLTKPPCWHHSACRNGAPQNSTAMAHLAEGGAGAWIEAWHHDSSKFCWWPFWKWGRRRANREPYILLTFFEPCIV